MLNEKDIKWDEPETNTSIDAESVKWDEEKSFIGKIADHYIDVKKKEAGWLKDAAYGGAKNIDEYGASINKGLSKILPESASDFAGLEENQKFWNDRKFLNDNQIESETAGLIGQMGLDPINATPAGLFTKGDKASRVVKSMAAGVGVGAGTMAFKNYGDDAKTEEQKLEEIGISAGFVSVLNGVIAGVTKGRVKSFVDASPEEKAQAMAKIAEEDEALFSKLNEAYSPEARTAPTLDEAGIKWDDAPEQASFKEEPMAENFGPLRDQPLGEKSILQDPDYKTLKEYIFEPYRSKKTNMNAEEAQTMFGGVGMSEDVIKQANKDRFKSVNHDIEAPQTTPRDLMDIEAGRATDEQMQRLQADMELINSPAYRGDPEAPRSMDDVNPKDDFGNPLFAKGADNLAAGTVAGIDTDENGNITFDPEKFVIGLGGYTAVKALAKSKTAQKTMKAYAQKAIDYIDMNPQVHKERGMNAMFVGSKGDEAGSFSDMATKKSMREIDDSKMKLKTIGSEGNTKINLMQTNQAVKRKEHSLDTVIEHEDLFKQYPELRNVKVKAEDLESTVHGSYDPKSNLLSINSKLWNSDDIKSTILHEIQHSVQGKEGWAKGGNIETSRGLSADKEQLAMDDLNAIGAELLNRRIGKPPSGIPMKTYNNQVVLKKTSDLLEYEKSFEKDLQNTQFKNYQRLHGEQQARATQARMDMAPEQRASEQWTDTLKRTEGKYDEPIIKYDDGVAMSTGQKTEPPANKNMRNGTISRDALLHIGASSAGAGLGAKYGSGTDINGDGKIDREDVALGAAMGLGIRYGAPKLLRAAEKGTNTIIKATANTIAVKPVKALDKAMGGKLSALSKEVLDNDIVDFVTGHKIYKKFGYMRYRTRMYADLSKNMQRHELMFKQLSNLSLDSRESLYKYMSGDRSVNLMPEHKAFADNTIAAIDKRGQQLVDLGVLEQAQFEKFKGMYLHRNYTKDYKAGISQIFSRGNSISGVHSRGHQWTGTATEYKELIKTNQIGDFKDGLVEVRKLPNGKYQFSRDWTPEQRARWGEIQDASYAIPETLSRLDDMIINATFLKNIAGSSKYISDDAAEGFVQLTGKRYGMLNGKYVPSDIASDIGALSNNLYGLAQDVSRKKIKEAAIKYISLWKASHTIWNPKAHVNNLMSNVTMQAMEGIPVATSIDNAVHGAQAYQKVNRITDLKAQQLKGLSAEEASELKTLLDDDNAKLYIKAQESGLFGRSQLNDILNDFMMKRSQHGQKEKGAIMRAKDRVERFAENAYQAEDNVMRFSLLKSLTDEGVDFKKALARVNSTIPDYTKPMSQAARFARNTGFIPFMSWTYYSMPIMMRQMKENPAKAISIIGGMTAIYGSFGVNPFSEEDLPTGFSYRRIPIHKDGNEITTLKVDKWFPHAQFANPVEFVRGMTSFGAWQPAVDAIKNRDSFTDRKINNRDDWHGDLDWAQFVTKNVLPSPDIADQIFSLIGSKMFEEEKRRNNKVVSPRSTKQELINIGGLNNLTYNKKEQLKKFRNERIREKQKENKGR